MTTKERTYALTSKDWLELNRLIEARERALLDITRTDRAHAADTSAYETAIGELQAWMDEHTDWGTP